MFIAGQIGWTGEGKWEARDFAGQFRQALKNILAVLAEANGKPEHIVRLTWYVLDKKEYLGVAEGRRRGLPRADGQALPDDGGGAGERPGRGRGAPRDRSHGGGASMKVSVIGGGPGGLYFALLAKKAWPRWDITVYERNRPDDTFGFGVVFSDQTLDAFKAYDAVTYERIRRRFAYWGDVDVVYKGKRDALRRQRLLRLLARARCSTSCRTAAASSACRCASSARSRAWRSSPTRT